MGSKWVYRLYNVLLLAALPFIALAVFLRWRRRVLSKGHERWDERCGRPSAEALRLLRLAPRRWWVHAVSVGEVKTIEPFLRQVAKQPDVHVLLTVVTPEALAWATEQRLSPTILAAPLDLPWIVRRVVRAVRPELFVSVESEFWPNLLREVKRSGARVALINGRLSANSYKSFHRVKRILPALWETIDLFAVRHADDGRRLADLGVPASKIRVTGHLKYDLLQARESPSAAPRGAGPVIALGSTRESEEAMLLPVLEKVRRQWPALTVIWAPRHVERVRELEALFRSKGLACRRKSAPAAEGDAAVNILWDSVGDLMEAYRKADIAIVGGSFVPRGGQNPIEPAALKRPVIFGPSMENFQGVAEKLVREGGALQISLGELEMHLYQLLGAPEKRRMMGENALRAVRSEQGASERSLKLLQELVNAR